MAQPEVSIVIVSFNTRDLLKKCLQSILKETANINCEVIVVDNASTDNSDEMIAKDFTNVKLIRNKINRGFAAGNNAGFKVAEGEYIVLLNSDAFLHPGALQKALQYIKSDPRIGLGGARLVSLEGNWQPSTRLFPSFINEFLQLSGLADKYPQSRFFGRFNQTYNSNDKSCQTDWITGAFAIIPRKILDQVGVFDERFFLYYEEVDLCKRIKAAGYRIAYWPDVVVTHLGGESSKKLTNQVFSPNETQPISWRMRSQLLYFRKHQGWLGAYAIRSLEIIWHQIRLIKNKRSDPIKADESRTIIKLMRQAWAETKGGTYSPPVPWN